MKDFIEITHVFEISALGIYGAFGIRLLIHIVICVKRVIAFGTLHHRVIYRSPRNIYPCKYIFIALFKLRYINTWCLFLRLFLRSPFIVFGAVFMATDYVTSPMRLPAQIIYSIGIGVIIVLIRKFGSYPEGVTYAILLMNIAAPLLDRVVPQRLYGHAKAKKEAK